MKYIFGPLILLSHLSEYGRLIKLVLKTSNGTKRATYWQALLRTILKFSYGARSKALIFYQLMNMKELFEISSGAIKIPLTILEVSDL